MSFFDYGVLFEVEYINEVSSLRAQEHLIDGGREFLKWMNMAISLRWGGGGVRKGERDETPVVWYSSAD